MPDTNTAVPAVQPKTIRIMCPNLKCRSILVVPENARGKNVKCSSCSSLFRIPAQAPVPAPKR